MNSIQLLLCFIICALVVMICWFILWCLRKISKGKKKYHWQIALPTSVVLTPFVFVGGLFSYITIDNYYWDNYFIRNPDFKRKHWDNQTGRRFMMVNSIIDTGLLMGKTSEEVTDILGEKKQYFVQDNNSNQIIYLLGSKNVDVYYLILNMQNNRVLSVEIKIDGWQLECELTGYTGP